MRGLGPSQQDFHFVQLSDVHLGYDNPKVNPDAKAPMRAIATVNALAQQPDFVIFTGDLTHTTDNREDAARSGCASLKTSRPGSRCGRCVSSPASTTPHSTAAKPIRR